MQQKPSLKKIDKSKNYSSIVFFRFFKLTIKFMIYDPEECFTKISNWLYSKFHELFPQN